MAVSRISAAALAAIGRDEVVRALGLYDRMGRETFLQRYGFRRARDYLIFHEGAYYDSKAVLGVAHGFLDGQEPLRPAEFSGGAAAAGQHLARLGFQVVRAPRVTEADVGSLPGLVDSLRVDTVQGAPRLYQPTTILWALGRVLRDESRLVAWDETREQLAALLRDHGLRGERPEPHYPLIALYHSGLWEFAGYQGVVPTSHGSDPQRWLTAQRPSGGLVVPVHALLRSSPAARLTLLDAVLRRFYVDVDAEPLLRAVGLLDDEALCEPPVPPPRVPPPADPVVVAAGHDRQRNSRSYAELCTVAERGARRGGPRTREQRSLRYVRSAAARLAVLKRCGGRCENPECAGMPTELTDRGQPILEVDHIQEISQEGEDLPRQMIALCPNCHAIKTRGSDREALRARLLAVAGAAHTRALRTGHLPAGPAASTR